MELSSPVTNLKGVGDKLAQILGKLGIFTLSDLITYYPRAYDKCPEIKKVADVCKPSAMGEDVLLRLKVKTSPKLSCIKKYKILSCVAGDETGSVAVKWVNQPYIKNILFLNGTYILRGHIKVKGTSFFLSNPRIIKTDEYEMLKSTYMPVYPLTKGINVQRLQKLVAQALDTADIPKEYLDESLGFMDYAKALHLIHFAKDRKDIEKARERLVFEEFLFFILKVRELRSGKRAENTFKISSSESVHKLLDSLPYELTGAQKRTLDEIFADMSSDQLMNRLVQGDVGSGKTIVAFAAMMAIVDAGYQAVLMAPTEVLARQHYEGLCKLLEASHIENVRCDLLVGSMSAKEKRLVHERLASGETDIAIGTHALIQDGVRFHDPGLVITDEQHRFGVNQRLRLSVSGRRGNGTCNDNEKNAAVSAGGDDGHERVTAGTDAMIGGAPDTKPSFGNDFDSYSAQSVHTMVMSATPIPRTLAIIIYGDLDISLIDELPAQRLPIKNCVVGPSYRNNAYNFIKKQLAQGRQALIICPMVEESEAIEGENVTDYVTQMQEIFEGYEVACLHGRMTGSEKDEIMNRFAKGDIKLLVSTTVVEVGINVPNTTVIMIENAERFGLAQLHQLRGRVGRGEHQSYCVFMCTTESEEAKKRLDILNKSNDGFKIAEEDLKQRGPGDIFGIRQSGDMSFALGDIYSDRTLLSKAAAYATEQLKLKEEGAGNEGLFERYEQYRRKNLGAVGL